MGRSAKVIPPTYRKGVDAVSGNASTSGMISVLIPTLNDADHLVAVLSPLVPASMEGLIRELIIVDAGSSDATLEIADDAGARTYRAGEGDLAQAIAQARGPWLLLLDPNVVLEPGWEASVRTHISTRQSAAGFRLERSEGGLLSALLSPRATAVLVLKQAAQGGAVVRTGGNRLQARVGKARRLDARANIV